MIAFPNAKINLGLHILNRRSDGFHNIESVLFPIGLSDKLELIEAPDGNFAFTSSGLQIPSNGLPNLCE
ncbi:MAG: 4-(cytidine 5'-diphospho)-2-C-methyl-D-erythritol kinase, partial [Bacteroidales bacterium]|nr:4-(cytidine 5'-diphospho)-2-C-methyl-D-erythritol kinase [Bacteroidales bacterium]